MFKHLIYFIITINIAFSQSRVVSLSLSGGGARGFAHLGALKAIEEFDIQIKAISGTSIGSVIGGMYASGYSTDEIEEFIRDFATSPSVFSDYSRKDIPIEYKFQKNSNIVDLAFENFKPLLPTSLSEDSRINYLLIKAFSGAGLESDNDFKHLKIPLTVVSSDIIQEKPVYFKSGNLAKIIRSSISLPIVLPPIEIDSMFLVDGGVYNNLPVDVFPDSDFVIAINTASQSYAKEQIKSFADITVQMVNILAAKSDSNSLKGWELFIEPEMEDITNTSWNLYQEAITAGYNETYKRLKESGFPLRNDIYSNKSNRLDLENFEIADIEIKGLYRLSKYFIQKELNLNDGDHFSWTNIKAGMNRLYSLKLIRFFWLDFKLTTENKLILTIEIKEENLTRMGIGGYYSNTMGNNIYVSYEMVGRLQQSEVISLEGYIGNYYNGISAKIRLPRLFNWPIFNQLSFTSDQRKYNPLKLSKAFHNTNVLSYDLGLLFDHNMILLGDIKYKRASFDIDSIDSGENFRTFSIGFSYNFETLDDLFFPTNGTSISIQYHFNNTVNVNNKNDVLDYNIFNINIENHNNILRNKFILSQRYKTIFTLSGSIPTLPIIEKTRLDLTRTTLGLFDGDLYGLHHSRLEIILKYNIVSDLFTYTSFVLGKTWNKKSDITFKSLSWDQLDRGAELGLYYPTIIGPILLTYSTDKFFKNQFRLSIGHIF